MTRGFITTIHFGKMVLAEMLSQGSAGLGHGTLVMAMHLGNDPRFKKFASCRMHGIVYRHISVTASKTTTKTTIISATKTTTASKTNS